MWFGDAVVESETVDVVDGRETERGTGGPLAHDELGCIASDLCHRLIAEDDEYGVLYQAVLYTPIALHSVWTR